ncbi:MAG: restriction endonuclease subunit S [Betaproteobacteria bacterium]|nr:restriction endonuclease subunit S [Betaproteobacteria bacterium]
MTAPKVEQTGPSDGDEFVYVDISSIDNQAKRIVDPKRLTPEVAPSRARQRLRKGDVLISMTRPNLNAVAIVPPDLDGAIGSTGFHVLRANDDVEPHWLYYAVQSSSFVKAMCDLVQGALYPAVRPKDIREYAISPPPLAKQREIVAELEKQFSRLDEAVANLQRVKANLKRYERATIASLTNPGSFDACVSGTIADIAISLDNLRKPVNKLERAKRPGNIPYLGANGQSGWSDVPLFDEELVLVVEDETFVGRTDPFCYCALMTAPISVPSLKKQAEVINEVERCLSIAREVESEVDTNLKRAQALRQTTLSKAFSHRTF